ncbi:MAG TPA: IS110 family transposase [Gammaproteobacteria bacterium]|nr:IS110 family transposase [Gammaproteobacteria bacterium]
MTIQTLGLDIGKSTFHAVGLDARGQPVHRHKYTRSSLMKYMANLPPCLVGMESCPGSQYLARRFSECGHTVRLMAAQFVKPYVKSNKSDYLDAEAIAEAVTRPTMRFVSVKTSAQQDLQAVHRVRSGLMTQRTAQINQLRAFLLENGLTIPCGVAALGQGVPRILEDAENGLSPRMRALVAELWQQIHVLETRIGELNEELAHVARTDPACQRLLTIPGVGRLTATALVAAIGNGQEFRHGRELAAFLGLVPQQYSTGGKPTLLGISKRGNTYLRMLFIHGARAVLRGADKRADRLGPWLRGLKTRRHANVAAVALANKLARIAWAVLVQGTEYRPTAA